MAIHPNELELSILSEILEEHSVSTEVVTQLKVTEREFTGSGSYIHFSELDSTIRILGNGHGLGLKKDLYIPEENINLGAYLKLSAGLPKYLKIYTYGDESWDGKYEGFYFSE